MAILTCRSTKDLQDWDVWPFLFQDAIKGLMYCCLSTYGALILYQKNRSDKDKTNRTNQIKIRHAE